MTPTENRILTIMNDWGENWKSYKTLSHTLGVEFDDKTCIRDLRLIMKNLKKDGLVTLESLWYEGQVMGRGYFLTRSGEEALS